MSTIVRSVMSVGTLMRTTFAKIVSSQKKSNMTTDEKIKMWIDEELAEHRGLSGP